MPRNFIHKILDKKSKKYFMFKNEQRRNSLRASSAALMFFWGLALMAFLVGLSMFAVGIALWAITFVLTMGFTQNTTFNLGNFLFVANSILFITAVVFSVVFVVKWVFEWLLIAQEDIELNQNKEENEKYLKVAAAVKRTRIGNIIALGICIAGLLGISAIFTTSKGQVTGEEGAWVLALLLTISITSCIARIYYFKQFYNVEDEIEEIKNEWEDVRRDREVERKLEKEIELQEKDRKAKNKK